MVTVLVAILFLGACKKDKAADVSVWIGRWNGPEATWMEITEKGEGVFDIQIRDLDMVRQYEGHAVEQGLSFERGGKTEIIRKGTGVETGMKWLADKEDCLVVAPNEGYCRD